MSQITRRPCYRSARSRARRWLINLDAKSLEIRVLVALGGHDVTVISKDRNWWEGSNPDIAAPTVLSRNAQDKLWNLISADVKATPLAKEEAAEYLRSKRSNR